MILLCQVCGTDHTAFKGSVSNESWIEAELVRRSVTVFPDHALAPMRQEYVVDTYHHGFSGGRESTLQLTWQQYYDYLGHQAQCVYHKRELFVTNPSADPKLRKDHNQQWVDRIYLDCDEAGSWEPLIEFCRYYGIPAIFHESAGSVRARTEEGDWNGPARSWHVEIPLAKRIYNPWASSGCYPPSDPLWRNWLEQIKRAIRHTIAFFSGFVFKGVGSSKEYHCGFDLTPTGLCVPRFLGTRSIANGPLPRLYMAPGNAALDWESFLHATGFVWQPYVPPAGNKKTVRTKLPDGSVREQVVSSFDNQLYEDVKQRITVNEFLQKYCNQYPTQAGSGGHYYLCPVHNEAQYAKPNKKGFHVRFYANLGIELWKCFGDCGDKARDVITLAAKLWGTSNGKAAWRLASDLGLDLNRYLAHAESTDSNKPPPVDPDPEPKPEEQSHEAFRAQEEEPLRPRRATQARQFDQVADWIEKWLLECDQIGKGVRAVASMLVAGEFAPPEQGKRGRGPMKSSRREPDEIAATLYSVLYEDLTWEQALGEVFDVIDHLNKARYCPGRSWIRKHLGYEALFELGVAMWRDDRKVGKAREFVEYAREVLSFDRLSITGTTEKKLLYYLSTHLSEFLPEPESQKERQARGSLVKQLKRPTACKCFYQKIRTTFGRELPDRWIVCLSKACTHCTMVDSLNEWPIVLKKWKKIKGPYYFVKVPLQRLEQVPHFKEGMRSLDRPKISVIGFEDGRPYLLYAVDNSIDRAYVQSRARVWYGGEIYERGNRELRKLKITTWETNSAAEAVGLVMAAKLSYHVHLRELVRKTAKALEAGELGNDEALKVLEFLQWSHRRQVVVSRSKKALPWVTKEELKAAREPKSDLAEGEAIVATLYDALTHTNLGTRQGVPFTADQAIHLAENSPSLKQAREAELKKKPSDRNPKARARAPTSSAG